MQRCKTIPIVYLALSLDIIYDPNANYNAEKPLDRQTEEEFDFINESCSFNFSNLERKKEITLGKYSGNKHLVV